jgi:glycine oxidase
MERTEIVVVGAGLIGATLAWRLARAGRKVVLLDRGEPGAEASTAAVGGLQPEARHETDAALLGLWVKSLTVYGAFVGEIREQTNTAFEYRVSGHLQLAFDDVAEQSLREKLALQRAAGIECFYLSGEEARRREPSLAPNVRGALLFPDHGYVDNQLLSRAVVQAAALAGTDVRGFEPVLAVASSGGRIDGVQTSRGQIAADVVVNAAGAWAASLVPTVTQYLSEQRGTPYLYQYRRTPAPGSAGAEESLPVVRPMKGEVVALRSQTRIFEHTLTVDGGTLVARGDGRVIVGGTVVEAGFDRVLTAGGVGELVAAAVGAVPALAEAQFLDAWTGLRPRTPDDRPIIGADRISGFYWATGHYKMGILSAPATADALASLIDGKAPAVPLDSLGPRRFGL